MEGALAACGPRGWRSDWEEAPRLQGSRGAEPEADHGLHVRQTQIDRGGELRTVERFEAPLEGHAGHGGDLNVRTNTLFFKLCAERD